MIGDFAFYGVDQGLAPTVMDVSADKGGNVYVVTGDAVYARPRDAQDFHRFTPADAGLTQNCHDPSAIANSTPPDPLATCPLISVAGGAAGKAVLGFQGVGVDYDYDAPWALDSGGADLVTFDPAAGTLTRRPGPTATSSSAPPTGPSRSWWPTPRPAQLDRLHQG